MVKNGFGPFPLAIITSTSLSHGLELVVTLARAGTEDISFALMWRRIDAQLQLDRTFSLEYYNRSSTHERAGGFHDTL